METQIQHALESYAESLGLDLTADQVVTRIVNDLAYQWAINGWRAGSTLSEEDRIWILENVSPI